MTTDGQATDSSLTLFDLVLIFTDRGNRFRGVGPCQLLRRKRQGWGGGLWILLSEGAQCLLLAPCFPLGSTSPAASPRTRQRLLSPSPSPQTMVGSATAAMHRAGQRPGEGHRLQGCGGGGLASGRSSQTSTPQSLRSDSLRRPASRPVSPLDKDMSCD